MNYEFASQELPKSIEESAHMALFKDRTIFLSKPITNQTTEEIIALLLQLDSVSDCPIKLLINSPGGSVSAGFGLIDCMNGLQSPVFTHAYGMAASMAAVVLANGSPGHRSITPNVEVLIHQPLMTNLQGQASDIEITAKSLIRTKQALCQNLAENTGRSIAEIEHAIDRDNYLTAEEAVEFGLADRIKHSWHFGRAGVLD